MCGPAAVPLIIGAASIGAGAYQANKAAKMQKAAQSQAQRAAAAQAQKAEEATNRALSKTPDTLAMLSANQRRSKGGIAGTMLTGPAGVNPSNLTLARTTLLGA